MRADAWASLLISADSLLIFQRMNRSVLIERLRAQETDLRRLGVSTLAVFGSMARGDDTEGSDVDLVICFDPETRPRGLAYVGRLEELSETLSGVLGRPVDIVVEPTVSPGLRQAIERDRVVAF